MKTNNKGQLGSTALWIPVAIITFLAIALYLIVAFTSKTTMGGVQNELVISKISNNDRALELSLANMIRNNQFKEEIIKKICNEYYAYANGRVISSSILVSEASLPIRAYGLLYNYGEKETAGLSVSSDCGGQDE